MPEPGGEAGLEELWARVLDAWDDDGSHAALLEFAVRTHALPAIASRYRSLVDEPDKSERARKKLDSVAAAATSMMLATRTPRAARIPRSITLSALATCGVLLAWLAWALWAR